MKNRNQLTPSIFMLVMSLATVGGADDRSGGFDIGPALDHALASAIDQGGRYRFPSLEAAEGSAGTKDPLETIPSAAKKIEWVGFAPASMSATPDGDSVLSPTGSTGAAPATEQCAGDWLVGGFDNTSRWVTAGLVLGLGTYFAVADADDVRDVGDVTQFLPGLAALGITIGMRDWDGLKQFGLAGGTAIILTHGIKETVDKTRPDTSANNSFPSGHTSASAFGAAFIWRRYGAKWGAPASIFAAYTGFSRVEGQKHFLDDVVSGVAVGLISNWLWTDPIDERVQMGLFLTQGGAGFNVGIDPSAPRPLDEPEWDEVVPQRYFAWEIGASHVTRNDMVAPNETGTYVDFRFDQENDPTVTAGVAFIWSSASGRYSLYGAFAPFEVREVIVFEEDMDFAGEVIPSGTSVQSRYAAYDYRLGASYAIVNKQRFRLSLGGALAVFDTDVGFFVADTAKVTRGAVVVRPVLSIGIEAALGHRWFAFARYHWWSDSSFETRDTTAQLVYRLHRKWSLSLGFRYVDRKIDASEFFNDVNRRQTALGVHYMW